jgi:tetratricopeptide (TPR) repeat protein
MSEAKPTSASVSAQRVKLASSLEWKNLLTHFELTDGEGFAFIVLLVADAEWAEACRLALERYLLTRKKKLQVVSFENAEEFRDELASRLLNLEIAPDAGAIWVAKAVTATERDYESWAAAWRTGVARLNQYRNPLIRRFEVPLIFVGAGWVQTILREMSPDLWSVRAMVVRIESLVSKTIAPGDASASTAVVSSVTIDAEGRAIDPEFALREAAQLRGRIGSEPTLARLLHRAGQGFNARSRWADGAEALREAVELYRRLLDIRVESHRLLLDSNIALDSPEVKESERRLSDSKDDLAFALFNLSASYLWQTDYAQATANLIEAQNLYREVGDVLGEANCVDSLGDIALLRSDHALAAERYEQALSLYREVGDLQGEANCVDSLGDIALRRSDHALAAERYEQALSLYREVGDLQGEANCVDSLGDIALRRSDHALAAERYEQALSLYREVGSLQGEANSIQSLGDIALLRSDHALAAERYEQALSLYREVGDLQGEANCIRSLGDIALQRSEHALAAERYEQALSLYREVGSLLGEANCIRSLGDIALQRSEHALAAERYEQALSLYREVGSLLGEANCIQSLGDIALQRSEHALAAERYEQALSLYREVGSLLGEANCIQSLGDIAMESGETERAAKLWTAALDLYELMAEPYSIGMMHRRLARIAASDAEREQHIEATRVAWGSIDRPDLIAALESEFAAQE